MRKTVILAMLLLGAAIPLLVGAGSKKKAIIEKDIFGHRVIFCGDQAAAATEQFYAPYLNTITGGTLGNYAIASANCNNLDNPDVGTADAPLGQAAYNVDGMYCEVSAAPGAAATVITFVDDTVNTAMTCSVGASATYCLTDPGLSISVAAGSEVAISSLNGTDDESAQDLHCTVYIAWRS